jgi:hypothetical protein
MPVFSKLASNPSRMGRPRDPQVAKALAEFFQGTVSVADAAKKFDVKRDTLRKAVERAAKRPAPAAASPPDQPPLKRARETFEMEGIEVRMSDKGPVMVDTGPKHTLTAEGKKRRFNNRHEVRRGIWITNKRLTSKFKEAFMAAQERLKHERTKPWGERKTSADICRCVSFAIDRLSPSHT